MRVSDLRPMEDEKRLIRKMKTAFKIIRVLMWVPGLFLLMIPAIFLSPFEDDGLLIKGSELSFHGIYSGLQLGILPFIFNS